MRARPVNLDGEAPLALYDSPDLFELGIDFSRPPAEIAAALTKIMQEAVDSGRWTRTHAPSHAKRCGPESAKEASPGGSGLEHR